MRSVIITAITLFALSGAILGFAIGAFTHARPGQQPTAQQQTTSKQKSTVTQTQAPRVTATATVAPPQKICGPAMSYTFIPDPTTGVNVYTITAQTKAQVPGVDCNKQIDKVPNITVSGIKARLWIVKTADAFPVVKEGVITDPINGLNDLANFPDEIADGLHFNGTTPQIQQTNNSGTVTWKVTLSPNLPKGAYRIVGMDAWGGTYFNWSWINVPVTK